MGHDGAESGGSDVVEAACSIKGKGCFQAKLPEEAILTVTGDNGETEAEVKSIVRINEAP